MKHMMKVMVEGQKNRPEDDFFETPRAAVEAIIPYLPKGVKWWEPACGTGAISKVLWSHDFIVVSSDIVSRGYGEPNIDFLSQTELRGKSQAIVTNPPFNRAESFIRHALFFKPVCLALLLKADYFHAKKRLPLFREHPPSEVYPMAWRLDFTGKKAPIMNTSWFIWRDGYRGATVYMPLEKNDGSPASMG